MAVEKQGWPEWSNRIRRLLSDLKLTQAGLAERLGVSPPTVSRWIQARQEPTAESYIALGNLARRPDGVYFWEQAGMDTSGIPEAGTLRSVYSLQVHLEDVKVIPGGKFNYRATDRRGCGQRCWSSHRLRRGWSQITLQFMGARGGSTRVGVRISI